MKILTKLALFVVCLQLGVTAVADQTQSEPMTNAEVIRLVKAGYPDTIVVLAIQRTESNFDTSAQALIGLKNQGVSEEILKAMLNPRPDDTPSGITGAPAAALDEVTLIDREERIPMDRSQISNRPSISFFGIGRSKAVRKFRGSRAALRITYPLPEFEVSLRSDLDPAEVLMILRLKTRSDRREIEIGRYSYPKGRYGFHKDAIIGSIIGEIKTYMLSCGAKYKLYRVKPAEPLDPGEYAFAPSVHIYELYDFGVDALTP